MVTVSGETVTLATSAGGVTSLSLHVPKSLTLGPLHTPALFRLSDHTGAADSDPASLTPMSVDTIPLAAPPTAVKLPSYERNSTTWLLALTSAIPSGLPFWIPFAA